LFSSFSKSGTSRTFFFELLLDFVHVVFGEDEIFAGAVHLAAGFVRPVPLGSRKYSPTGFWTFWLEMSNQRTMKSAFIAVTKSA
jgi:hypothetical protein